VPARIDRVALRALACLLPCAALAQAPQWPGPTDIDRALKANPFPSADRIGSQPIPRPPRVDPQRGGVDIEALARRQAHIPQTSPLAGSVPVPLRIFVTLEMPRASLQLLTDQAARTGAVLVLRGIKAQSMRATLDAVRELIGERNVAWTIDPQAFTRYAIRHAPSFVISLSDTATATPAGCTTNCPTAVAFVSVAGDVSLDYALEAILRRKPETASRVAPILHRLRGS
jgi:conjugal transfer pilus assembly protein TrbC